MTYDQHRPIHSLRIRSAVVGGGGVFVVLLFDQQRRSDSQIAMPMPATTLRMPSLFISAWLMLGFRWPCSAWASHIMRVESPNA